MKQSQIIRQKLETLFVKHSLLKQGQKTPIPPYSLGSSEKKKKNEEALAEPSSLVKRHELGWEVTFLAELIDLA